MQCGKYLSTDYFLLPDSIARDLSMRHVKIKCGNLKTNQIGTILYSMHGQMQKVTIIFFIKSHIFVTLINYRNIGILTENAHEKKNSN